jgi:hypothetical protein
MEKISLLQEIVKQLEPGVQDVIIYDPYHIRLTCVCKVKEAKEQSGLHLSPWSQLWCFTYENLSADFLARIAERQSLLEKKEMKRRIALLAPDHPSLEETKSLLHVFDQIVYYEDLLDKVDFTCKRGRQIPLQYEEAAKFSDKHSKSCQEFLEKPQLQHV